MNGFNVLTFILLVIFIFMAPAMPMPKKSTIGFISPALIGVLGIVIMYNIMARRPVMIINNYVVAILVCYFTLCLSDIFCVILFEPSTQIPYVIARTATLVLFIAAISYEPSIERIELMVRIYCWSIAALSALVILQGFGFVTFDDPDAVSRQGRIYFGARLPFKKAVGFPMSDGEFGIMVAPAFFYCLLQFCGGAHHRPMRFSGLFLILTFMALVIAQSRSTWLGLAVALPVVVLFIPRRNIDRWLLVLVGIAVAALVGSQVYSHILTGLVSDGVLAKNAYGRFASFAIALEMAKDAPIFGRGHGTVIFLSESDQDSHVIHNHFVHALTAGGLIAAVPSFLLYGLTAFKMFDLARAVDTDPVLRVFSICILGAMIQTVFELFFYRGFYSEHLPWLIGTSCLVYALQKGGRQIII